MAPAIALQLFEPVAFAANVHLRRDDGEGTRVQRLVIGSQFLSHDVKTDHGLFRRPFRNIDEMEQVRGALDVAEKLKPKTSAFMGAFNQAGNVGDNEAAVGSPSNDAEVRNQRREKVIGNF